MAKSSLYDLSSFLNRWPWRIEFPFDKSAWLHIFYAAGCCLLPFSPAQVQWAVRLRCADGKKGRDGPLWAILVHALVQRVTGVSQARAHWRGGPSTQPAGRRYETQFASCH